MSGQLLLMPHRHHCVVLPKICAFNGTILPLAASADLARFADTMMVRSPTFSHHEMRLALPTLACSVPIGAADNTSGIHQFLGLR